MLQDELTSAEAEREALQRERDETVSNRDQEIEDLKQRVRAARPPACGCAWQPACSS